MTYRSLLSRPLAAALAVLWLVHGPARAHDPSGASAVSTLPIAVSVTASAGAVVAPFALVGSAAMAGSVLAVVAVQAVAEGTVWMLERASDGARWSVRVSSDVGAAASVAVGTAVTVTAVGSGLVLSAAGRAIAYVPNELGRALTYHERVTR